MEFEWEMREMSFGMNREWIFDLGEVRICFGVLESLNRAPKTLKNESAIYQRVLRHLGAAVAREWRQTRGVSVLAPLGRRSGARVAPNQRLKSNFQKVLGPFSNFQNLSRNFILTPFSHFSAL